MSTIQQNAANIHQSFHHFSKLVHLPAILRRANITKTRGVRVTVLFEWLLTTIFNRYSIYRRRICGFLQADSSQLLKQCAHQLATTCSTRWYPID
ncbi:hypothetical protein C5L29_001893 [Lactiplantibacillus pentosus]|nr:hypothetical protein C5L29_001893 [Lactiplantibacillus pentosus]